MIVDKIIRKFGNYCRRDERLCVWQADRCGNIEYLVQYSYEILLQLYKLVDDACILKFVK